MSLGSCGNHIGSLQVGVAPQVGFLLPRIRGYKRQGWENELGD